MNENEIYTVMRDVNTFYLPDYKHSRHLFCDEMLIPCHFTIYEKPEDALDILDDDDMPTGKMLGGISGTLILGQEISASIEESDQFLYKLCDDWDPVLSAATSALLSYCGPLSSDREVFGVNYFYIDHIVLHNDAEKLMQRILRELPYMVLAHMHVFPELLCYYPSPLEKKVEFTEQDKMLLDLAAKTQEAIVDLMLEGKYDMNDPQLMLTPFQMQLLSGNRGYPFSYPADQIDEKEWKPFLDAGFAEWMKTRVLFKYTEDREDETENG